TVGLKVNACPIDFPIFRKSQSHHSGIERQTPTSQTLKLIESQSHHSGIESQCSLRLFLFLR
ncbi:MAG: hypothetical protein N3B10_14300, partial [Armatimonadetes bacterium]|nr:hypothetical protein [Armatimonadota bacterium]